MTLQERLRIGGKETTERRFCGFVKSLMRFAHVACEGRGQTRVEETVEGKVLSGEPLQPH